MRGTALALYLLSLGVTSFAQDYLPSTASTARLTLSVQYADADAGVYRTLDGVPVILPAGSGQGVHGPLLGPGPIPPPDCPVCPTGYPLQVESVEDLGNAERASVVTVPGWLPREGVLSCVVVEDWTETEQGTKEDGDGVIGGRP